MRDKLDDLRFKIFDINYSIKLRIEAISDRTKLVTLSFLILLWMSIYGFIFYEAYDYNPDKEDLITVGVSKQGQDIIKQAETWIGIGSDAEAFELLAMHRNHFKSNYSKEEISTIESLLTDLTKDAKEADIKVLYTTKDLVEQQPIYKFVGTVIQIDSDTMYGVTYSVSNSGERDLEQLEVTGLEDMSIGSQVEFFGVPKFDSVTSPIKVEAYMVPMN